MIFLSLKKQVIFNNLLKGIFFDKNAIGKRLLFVNLLRLIVQKTYKPIN